MRDNIRSCNMQLSPETESLEKFQQKSIKVKAPKIYRKFYGYI